HLSLGSAWCEVQRKLQLCRLTTSHPHSLDLKTSFECLSATSDTAVRHRHAEQRPDLTAINQRQARALLP
ncbi:hypothetical protein KUCAC02_001154, partial [Chaenocephalus aceratus]